jgi:hypothetical protein
MMFASFFDAHDRHWLHDRRTFQKENLCDFQATVSAIDLLIIQGFQIFCLLKYLQPVAERVFIRWQLDVVILEAVYFVSHGVCHYSERVACEVEGPRTARKGRMVSVHGKREIDAGDVRTHGQSICTRARSCVDNDPGTAFYIERKDFERRGRNDWARATTKPGGQRRSATARAGQSQASLACCCGCIRRDRNEFWVARHECHL